MGGGPKRILRTGVSSSFSSLILSFSGQKKGKEKEVIKCNTLL